jgi:hypothetical protein
VLLADCLTPADPDIQIQLVIAILRELLTEDIVIQINRM